MATTVPPTGGGASLTSTAASAASAAAAAAPATTRHSADAATAAAAGSSRLAAAEPTAKQYPSKYQAPAREMAANEATHAAAAPGAAPKKSMDALFDIPNGLEVGAHFPLFECHAVDGTLVTSSALRGKAFALFGIQSMNVHGDMSQLQEMQQMHAHFTKAGIQVLALCTNTAEECRPVMDRLGLTFPILCDTTGDSVSSWGINMNGHRRSKALRAAFLVNTQGAVVYCNVNFKARGGVSALFHKREQFLNPKRKHY